MRHLSSFDARLRPNIDTGGNFWRAVGAGGNGDPNFSAVEPRPGRVRWKHLHQVRRDNRVLSLQVQLHFNGLLITY